MQVRPKNVALCRYSSEGGERHSGVIERTWFFKLVPGLIVMQGDGIEVVNNVDRLHGLPMF